MVYILLTVYAPLSSTTLPVLLRTEVTPTSNFCPFKTTTNISLAFSSPDPLNIKLNFTYSIEKYWASSGRHQALLERGDWTTCAIPDNDNCLRSSTCEFWRQREKKIPIEISGKIHKQLILSVIQVYLKGYKGHKFKQLWQVTINKGKVLTTPFFLFFLFCVVPYTPFISLQWFWKVHTHKIFKQ